MLGRMASVDKFHCQDCSKGFLSELQLKIHTKCKHSAMEVKNDNINSSDISQDEEQNMRRYRDTLKKNSQENDTENGKFVDWTVKNNLPGRFDDPTLVQDGNKKLYLCGCSHRTFENSENLTRHISKLHNGFPPQGTLYGVCRDLVLKRFPPSEQRQPTVRYFFEKSGFVCGCGLSYTRYPSLKYHILKNHDGVAPIGTIGLKNQQKPNHNPDAQITLPQPSSQP